MTPEERQLINDIINITELYNSMTHDQQLDRLKAITADEKYHIQALQDILSVKYATAASYFKPLVNSVTGKKLGNKIPLEGICRLCIHYNRSLDWFLKKD